MLVYPRQLAPGDVLTEGFTVTGVAAYSTAPGVCVWGTRLSGSRDRRDLPLTTPVRVYERTEDV